MNQGLAAVKFMRDALIARNSEAEDRIYISVAPQDVAYPMVIMDIISAGMSPTQDSSSAVDEIRVQVDVFAKNTAAKSGFLMAMEVQDEARKAWPYVGGVEGAFTIDLISEENYRTDWLPELNVQQAGSDWIIRVK